MFSMVAVNRTDPATYGSEGNHLQNPLAGWLRMDVSALKPPTADEASPRIPVRPSGCQWDLQMPGFHLVSVSKHRKKGTIKSVAPRNISCSCGFLLTDLWAGPRFLRPCLVDLHFGWARKGEKRSPLASLTKVQNHMKRCSAFPARKKPQRSCREKTGPPEGSLEDCAWKAWLSLGKTSIQVQFSFQMALASRCAIPISSTARRQLRF